MHFSRSTLTHLTYKNKLALLKSLSKLSRDQVAPSIKGHFTTNPQVIFGATFLENEKEKGKGVQFRLSLACFQQLTPLCSFTPQTLKCRSKENKHGICLGPKFLTRRNGLPPYFTIGHELSQRVTFEEEHGFHTLDSVCSKEKFHSFFSLEGLLRPCNK